MAYLCYNGEFFPAINPVLTPANHSFRYGDGLFETMRFRNGNLLLSDYHFQRLFDGMKMLQFGQLLDKNRLTREITELCRLNKCADNARVRLSVSRGSQHANKPGVEYTIECEPLDHPFQWNEAGLTIDVFQDARKTCDAFSNLKSTSRLAYVMAGLYAREQKLDDCLLLNTDGFIADATIANVFIIQGNTFITPSLDQGCVAGVMRRYLIEKLRAASHELREIPCDLKQLEMADEVFLTNAVRGIQWVRSCKGSVYTHERTKEIFDQFIRNFKPVSHQNGD